MGYGVSSGKQLHSQSVKERKQLWLFSVDCREPWKRILNPTQGFCLVEWVNLRRRPVDIDHRMRGDFEESTSPQLQQRCIPTCQQIQGRNLESRVSQKNSQKHVFMRQGVSFNICQAQRSQSLLMRVDWSSKFFAPVSFPAFSSHEGLKTCVYELEGLDCRQKWREANGLSSSLRRRKTSTLNQV